MLRAARTLVWPKLDLGLRLWIGKIFFVSGILKLTNWQVALDLATHEYPVSWMRPEVAATVGVTIEVVGGALLSAGLLTRYAAIPMLVLALVIQAAYLPFDQQLYWAALLSWYVVHGASTLSLDHLLRKGLADSALPLVPRLLRLSRWVREQLSPFYASLLRLWIGLALCGPLLGWAGRIGGVPWLPLSAAGGLPRAVAAWAGLMLLAGFATRYVAGALLLAGSAGAMMQPEWEQAGWLAATLGLLLVFGPGPLSLDAALDRMAARWLARRDERQAEARPQLPRVVIVGAGFGGLACASGLRRADCTVTLIDRANHHLFQPLLYQVATAGLSPGDIAAPIRPLFRDAPHVQVRFGTVTGVDTGARTVTVDGQAVGYDYLVLATGATHSYFGKDDWARHAPGLKRIEDATAIRRRILTAFERAEAAETKEARDALLTFLIVGGGPTGVELAGAIAELSRHGMDKEFRNFDPASARIILVQSAPRLLPTFPEALSARARQSLEALGVEVRLGSRVELIDDQGISVSGQRIAARTVLWAAGVKASPAARWIGVEPDSSGRVRVGTDLAVPSVDGVYAIGDTAASQAWNGQPVPGLAPAAKQAGAHVARVLRARLAKRRPPPPFVYHHRGSLATIGRKSAVADFGRLRLWGAPAWWLWGLVHVGFLVGVRNRVSTIVNWFWSYLTFGGGIRLITGSERDAAESAG